MTVHLRTFLVAFTLVASGIMVCAVIAFLRMEPTASNKQVKSQSSSPARVAESNRNDKRMLPPSPASIRGSNQKPQPIARENVQGLLAEAITLYKRKDYAASLRILDLLLQLNGHSQIKAEALRYRGLISFDKGDYLAALRDFDVLVEMNPSVSEGQTR